MRRANVRRLVKTDIVSKKTMIAVGGVASPRRFVLSLQADTVTEAAALLVLLLARHPPRPTRCCRDGRPSFTASVPACATACRMCVVIVLFGAGGGGGGGAGGRAGGAPAERGGRGS